MMEFSEENISAIETDDVSKLAELLKKNADLAKISDKVLKS